MKTIHVLREWDNSSMTWCDEVALHGEERFNNADFAAGAGFVTKIPSIRNICKKCADNIIDSINNIKER